MEEQKSPTFKKKIFIYVLKMNIRMGLEHHEGD